MQQQVSAEIILDAVKKEIDRRKAENNLYEFVKQAWHVVEPGVEFVPSWHIHTICDHLEAITNGDIRRLLINIPPRHALDVNTMIPTTRGIIPMRDVRVGDHVFGPDGRPTEVLGKSDVFKDRQVYRVTTDDGASVDVDGEHLWTVRLNRKYAVYRDYTTEQLWHRQNGTFVRTLRSGEVEVNATRICTNIRLPRLPDVQPIQYPHRDLSIDPYVLGVWLGDGTSSNGSVTMHPDDAIEVMGEMKRRGWVMRKTNSTYRHLVEGLQKKLREAGLLKNKHIPDEYLIASTEQRRSLLKGLMDTDGNVSKKGQCFFSQSNRALIDQVAQLIRSLGIKANIIESEAKLNGVSHGPTWRVSFYANDVAALKRKEARTLKNERTFGRYIKIAQLDQTADMQCIRVARPDGLFMAGDGYIITHNSKSTIVSVMWPMWEWISNPSHQYLCASYANTLSIRDSIKARRLITSQWYQERWGDRFQLAGDQNAKQRFENDKMGHRIATSVGSGTTGEGGSRLMCDDPHSAIDAQSDAMREAAVEWFDAAFSTRMNNPKTDAMIVVMQRLHEMDISGHILNDLKGWEHVCIPAEFDGARRVSMLGAYDPRTKVGELICPNRFGQAELEVLKGILGTYGAAGQLQQDPSPSDGGILQIKYFKMWPHTESLPPFSYIIQSYDCAFTEKSSGDPTACTVWGVFMHKGMRNVMLIDAWDEHLAYPQLRQRVIDDWTTEYGGAKDKDPFARARRPDRIIVEAKASGQSLLQDLRQANVPAIGYNPGKADKVARAHQTAPVLEMEVIWIPESSKNKGMMVNWASRFLKQVSKFPVAEHDDYVDTFTQAMIYLKAEGFFDMPKAATYNHDARPSSFNRERVNPYAE